MILKEMTLSQKEKNKIIEKYKLHEKDTGSSEVQIALLTEEIANLISHLKKHPKDLHSKKGLIKMVAKRRKLLKFLQNENESRYKKLIKLLGLKK
jgi:small subunit ribosomal protein S15